MGRRRRTTSRTRRPTVKSASARKRARMTSQTATRGGRKRRTPTSTRRTIARIKTPVSRKAPIAPKAITRTTRAKINSSVKNTRLNVPRIPIPRGRGTAPPPRPVKTKPVIRTTVPRGGFGRKTRGRSTVVRRVIPKPVTPPVKRNKRDRGFTRATNPKPASYGAPFNTPRTSPVSVRASGVGIQPRGVDDAAEYLATMRERGTRMGEQIQIGRQRAQSGPLLGNEVAGGFRGANVPQSFITQSLAERAVERDQYIRGGNDFNIRDRDLVLAGQDRDIPLGNRYGDNLEKIINPPIPTPSPTVPSNPKDVVVSGTTFLNGKSISGVILRENGNTDGTRSPASRRYNIKSLLGAGKTFTAEHNKYKSDEYYTEIDKRIRVDFPHKFDNNETIATTKPVQSVASANRSVKPGRKQVRLTSSQVAIAKKLGVPLEEYAKQLKLTEGA